MFLQGLQACRLSVAALHSMGQFRGVSKLFYLDFELIVFYARMARLEPWWSGLTYLFAKEAGLNGPRGFESLRFRNERI